MGIFFVQFDLWMNGLDWADQSFRFIPLIPTVQDFTQKVTILLWGVVYTACLRSSANGNDPIDCTTNRRILIKSLIIVMIVIIIAKDEYFHRSNSDIHCYYKLTSNRVE